MRRIALLACLAWAAWGPCFAQRPPMVVPASADVVLERLPRGYADIEPRAGARAPLAEAQALLSAAARTGDGRLATRAEALLTELPLAQRTTPAARHAAAFAAQHRHDFARALAILGAEIAAQPRDAETRFARAQVYLVEGRLREARADCAALALGIDADSGLLCIAAVSMRRGDADGAARLLDRRLLSPPRDHDVLRYLLVMRGEAASRANDAGADAWFRRALALSPDDVRTYAAFARHLRAHGRPRDALALLARAPDTDALLLQRALAAQAAGVPEAPRLAQRIGQRYALAHALGAPPELRDEADHALLLRGNATQALVLAQHNFATQRDVEDVDVLRRAATAARRADILAAVDAWMKTEGLVQPVFAR